MATDDDWFESLAGRERPGAAAEDKIEGQLLRAALLNARVESPAWNAKPDVDALVNAVRAATPPGRAGGRFCAGCTERWQQWIGIWRAATAPGWMAGAAVVAVGAVTVGLVVPLIDEPADTQPQPRVLRGAGPNGVTLLDDAEPAQRRDSTADVLELDGARVRRYDRLGRHGLDAELPHPLPPATSDALLKLGVAAPDVNAPLRLEWEQRAR